MSDEPAAGPADLLKSLSRYEAESGKLPPVHLWNPPLCENLKMRIDRSGRWYYMDSPIGRERMVRLFSTVLRKDPDGLHYLVTPVEKVLVEVEDCPFVVVAWDSAGSGRDRIITFATNTGDRFALDAEHPLRVDELDNGEPAPRVPVRAALEALVNRNVFYQLVDLALSEAEPRADGRVGLYSCGEFFTLGHSG